jgi:membrane protease YdiL (CAAX protease family)
MPTATLLNVCMPPAMAAAFAVLNRGFGARSGYRIGFAVYWAACIAVSVAVLGRQAGGLFRRTASLPPPKTVAAAVLAIPVAGAIATQLVPNLRRTTSAQLGVSIGLATVNATAEELFWRGLPSLVHPNDPVRGWLLPAAAFTAWHVVPLAAAGSMRRAPGLLFGAGMIGLGYGWIAWRTGSLRWTLLPHIATDASGVAAVARMWMSGR